MKARLPRRLLERCRAAVADARRYLHERQSPLGGFCFYRWQHIDEPNLGDTFHAVAALHRIGAAIPHADRVEKFLHVFPTAGLDALYYRAFTHALLDDAAPLDEAWLREIRDFTLPVPSANGRAPSSGALERTRRALTLKRRFATLDGVDVAGIRAGIDGLWRGEGGYGAAKPNLWDTWLCLAILDRLDAPLPVATACRFLDGLQFPAFGFVATRDSLLAALEIAYAGVRCCALLAQPVRYPEAVLDFVLACRDGDGGFARAPDALPNIELTYQALGIIADLCGEEVFASSR